MSYILWILRDGLLLGLLLAGIISLVERAVGRQVKKAGHDRSPSQEAQKAVLKFRRRQRWITLLLFPAGGSVSTLTLHFSQGASVPFSPLFFNTFGVFSTAMLIVIGLGNQVRKRVNHPGWLAKREQSRTPQIHFGREVKGWLRVVQELVAFIFVLILLSGMSAIIAGVVSAI